jgi:carbon-monoxide dehydrogenase medium subunit
VKPPEFDYVAPESLAEAHATLAPDPDAKVLAGGQSLIALLALRMSYPTTLVDLRRVPGLSGVKAEDGVVRIGAMTTQRQAERDATLAERVPLVGEALRHVAHPQIRNRGTVGGSIAHADPAAELPAVLLALDGRLHASSARGSRVIEADGFFAGFLMTALEPDEIVTAVEFKAAPPRTGAACAEVARRHGDYALAGAVAQVSRGGDGAVSETRVALLGVGDRPVRATAVEQALTGSAGDEAAIRAAAAGAGEGWSPVDDPQLSADYRVHLARVVTRRALEQAMERAS